MRFLLAMLLLPMTLSPAARAQGLVSEEMDRAERGAKLTRDFARRFSIHTMESPELGMDLVERPLLRWSNPVTGSLYGSVYLWVMDDGSPVAVASVIKWYSPRDRLEAELHSMIESPIDGFLDGVQVWDSDRAGVEFQKLPTASVSTESDAVRLQQMRRIARAFEATGEDSLGRVRQLRLLPQPIYRYPAGASGKIDGAIFVFAQGTNPEIVLAIEARATDTGSEWVYAFARMNGERLRVRRRNDVVWDAPILKWSTIIDPREPYLIVRPR